jgi:hypothetical protein
LGGRLPMEAKEVGLMTSDSNGNCVEFILSLLEKGLIQVTGLGERLRMIFSKVWIREIFRVLVEDFLLMPIEFVS